MVEPEEENGRQEDASRPTKRNVLAGKEEAGGYNGYLYYRREKAKPTEGSSQLPKWSWYHRGCGRTAFRYGRPTELRSNWSTLSLPPLPLLRDINIDENDTFIRERQVRPRRKSREIYWDAAPRRQPFLRRSYIKRRASRPILFDGEESPPPLSPIPSMRFLFLDRAAHTADSLKSVVSGSIFFKRSRRTRLEMRSFTGSNFPFFRYVQSFAQRIQLHLRACAFYHALMRSVKKFYLSADYQSRRLYSIFVEKRSNSFQARLRRDGN